MAKIWSKEYKVVKMTWDFADQGGAVGTIALGDLPSNFVVQKMDIYCETAPVGGGTITVGDAGDTDGYHGDMDALSAATLTRASGALIYDSTDDHDISYVVPAADDGVVLEIATTAYTAGKIHFYFTGFQLDE